MLRQLCKTWRNETKDIEQYSQKGKEIILVKPNSFLTREGLP